MFRRIWGAVALAAGLGGILAAPAAALDFAQPSGSPVSTGELTVNTISTGDLNGDGRDDVVTANADYSFSVFLSGASGAPIPAPGSPVDNGGDYLLSAALVDFDMDEDLDVAAAGNDYVRVYPGNGDGTFGAPYTDIPTAVDGTDIAVGHFDPGPEPDLAVVGWTENRVDAIHGNGAGSWTRVLGINVNTGPIDIAVADFDENGQDDFATANETNDSVSVLLFEGEDVEPAPGSRFPAYSDPRGITTGDWNGDGNQDFVAVHRPDQRLRVMLGTGTGSFDNSNVPEIDSNWGNSIATGDFDADGRDDAVVGKSSSISDPLDSSAMVFRGTAAGTLIEASGGPWEPTSPAYPWEVATGDVNGDGALDFVSGDQGGRASVFLQELGGLTADPTSHDFGSRDVGLGPSNPQSFTFTSSGTGQVDIISGAVTLTGADADQFQISANDCEATNLDPTETCSVSVTFDPSSAGTKSAALSVASNAPGSPTTVALVGTGTATPEPAIAPSSHDFGNRAAGTGPGAPQAFTITNEGSATVTVSAVQLAGEDADQFDLGTEDCVLNPIAPGSSCTISVSFAPTAIGPASAELRAINNSAANPLTASLSGTGIEDPGIAVAPTGHDFGERLVEEGPAAGQEFVVESTGSTLLLIGFLEVSGPDASEFAITQDSCSSSGRLPGESCAFTVVFDPSGVGEAEATIEIPNNEGGNEPLAVPVSGTGTDRPRFQLTPPSHDFGTRTTGSGSGEPRAFALANSGQVPFAPEPAALAGPGADQFARSGDGCAGRPLAPGESCEVRIAFAPTAAGEKAASLSIPVPGGGVARAELSGMGEAPIPPPTPCQPVEVERVAYFEPKRRKASRALGARARIETDGPAVVRVSSKLIYRQRGKQRTVKFLQRQLEVAGSFVNYKVALPARLGKQVRPNQAVRFVITYSSRASLPGCEAFGERRTRSLSTRFVWVTPSG